MHQHVQNSLPLHPVLSLMYQDHTLTPYFIKIHLNASPIYAPSWFQIKILNAFLTYPTYYSCHTWFFILIRPPLLHLVQNKNYVTHHYAVFVVFIFLPTIKFQYSLGILFSTSICVFSSTWDQAGTCSSHILDIFRMCLVWLSIMTHLIHRGFLILFNYFVIFLSPPGKYQDQISIKL